MAGKYTKPPKDPRGGHVRLYWDLIDSAAWRALGWADQGLYIAMRRKLGSTNNGNIEAALVGTPGKPGLREAAGITAPSSLAKGLRALVAVGLIVRTREGKFSQGSTICNLFRFTDERTYEIPAISVKALPATNEWRAFESVAEAKAAIAAADKAVKTGLPRRRKNAKPLQPLKCPASTIELAGDFADSTIEVGGTFPIQPLKSEKKAQPPAKPRRHSVLEVG